MESKVLLFDANDTKVGETFMRRARQLVNQQRAEWVDDSHSAIRFAPDIDEWEKEIVSPTAITTEIKDANWIYALAEKRLHERKMFIIHTVGLIPGFFGILIFFFGIIDSIWWHSVDELFWFSAGAWTMAYIIHVYFFARTRLKGFRLADKEERRAQRLALEVDKLKRMGYVDKA